MKRLFNSLLVMFSILLIADPFILAAKHHHKHANKKARLNAKAIRQKPQLVRFLNKYYQVPPKARGQFIARLRNQQNKQAKRQQTKRQPKRNGGSPRNNGNLRRSGNRHQGRPAARPAPKPVVHRPVVSPVAPAPLPAAPVVRPVVPASPTPQVRPTPIPGIPRPIAQFVINRALNRNWYGMDNKLPLPSSVRGLPFEYIHSKQQNGWSCGYNCLYNACNVENYFGRNNQNSDLNKFSRICLNYLNQIGANPAGAGHSNVLEKLAVDLKLQKFVYLENGSGYVAPLISHWSWSPGRMTSDQAKQIAQNKKVQDIKKHLANNRGSTTFVHFLCHVNDYGPHAVLVSLVQKPNGNRSFYIFDNLNAQITEHSHVVPYLKYINNNFK